MVTIKYVQSLILFYLRGKISIDKNFVELKTPNTILGLIPLGSYKEKIAINQISSTSSNFKLKLGRIILGIFIFWFSIISFTEDIPFVTSLIFMFTGISVFLDGFEIDLIINLTSGQIKYIDFFLFDKSKADLASNQINNHIENRLNETNVNVETDRLINVLSSKKEDTN